MPKILGAFLLCMAAQATSLNVTVSITATVTVSTGGNYAASGTANLTGGITDNGTFSATIPLSAISGTTVNISYTMNLSQGTMAGNVSIPITAFLGGTSSASGTLTVTSGTGSYSGDTGSFNVSGSGGSTASGAITVSFGGPGTMTTSGTPSNLTRIGVLAQLAAGGGWDTAIYMTNTTLGPLSVEFDLHANDGTALSLPLAVTQQGNTNIVTTSTLTAVIPAKTTLSLDTEPASTTSAGWVDVLSNGSLTGFAVFRYAPQGLSGAPGTVTPWEGTVALQTQLSPTLMVVPFDNTNGFATGIALGNLSTSPADFTATFYDDKGNPLGTPQTISLPGNGHTSFILNSQYGFTSNLSGIMEITGGELMGVGLRASPYGTLTDIPVPLQ